MNMVCPERILIVEDDPAVRTMLSRLLAGEGYSCVTAPDAERALRLLESDGFSLLVTDLRLPGNSGTELLRAVKKRRPDVVVLVMTEEGNRETAVQSVELGAHAYLIKPLNEDNVVLNIANALQQRRIALLSQEYERKLEQTVRQQTDELRLSREEIALRLMTAQHFRHDESGAHVRRIGLYAEVLAEGMGKPPEERNDLRLAAPIHDVGKIGVPDSILLKPGPLDPAETEIMKTHTTIGGRILEGSALPLVNMARDIALYHHEKWNGAGYPEGLAGEAIPEPARIVAVLDVYDALTHERVYRPAFTEEKALEIMSEGRGSHFDPHIYDVFMRSLDELRRIKREVTG